MGLCLFLSLKSVFNKVFVPFPCARLMQLPKDAGNSYQRILKYIIDKLQKKRDTADVTVNDEEVFAKDNFGIFPF